MKYIIQLSVMSIRKKQRKKRENHQIFLKSCIDKRAQYIHSLQDIDAHSPEYQKIAQILGVDMYYHDSPTNPLSPGQTNLADDPDTNPARLENSRRMTNGYLDAFNEDRSTGSK